MAFNRPDGRSSVLNSHIELDERGRAWIIGANTKVIEVAIEKVAWDWNPEQMHRQHPHLSLAQLHAAMSWYYDRKEEFDAEIERQRIESEPLAAESRDSPFGRKLRRMKAILATDDSYEEPLP